MRDIELTGQLDLALTQLTPVKDTPRKYAPPLSNHDDANWLMVIPR
jgi:hypothetical protein